MSSKVDHIRLFPLCWWSLLLLDYVAPDSSVWMIYCESSGYSLRSHLASEIWEAASCRIMKLFCSVGSVEHVRFGGRTLCSSLVPWLTWHNFPGLTLIIESSCGRYTSRCWHVESRMLAKSLSTNLSWVSSWGTEPNVWRIRRRRASFWLSWLCPWLYRQYWHQGFRTSSVALVKIPQEPSWLA